MFWLSVRSMAELSMPATFCGSECGTVSFGGESYQVAQINPKDGTAACGACGGCALGFVGLVAGSLVPDKLRPGDNVSMVFTTGRLPPSPPPTPSIPATVQPACRTQEVPTATAAAITCVIGLPLPHRLARSRSNC
jgi:hypothetical protein